MTWLLTHAIFSHCHAVARTPVVPFPSWAQRLSEALWDGLCDTMRITGCVSQAMQDGLFDMEGLPDWTCVLRQQSTISLAFCKDFPLTACKSLWKIWFLPTLEITSSSSVAPLAASHALSRCLQCRTFHWEETTWIRTETDSEGFPGAVGKQ